jgi:hypothetical protein
MHYRRNPIFVLFESVKFGNHFGTAGRGMA